MLAIAGKFAARLSMLNAALKISKYKAILKGVFTMINWIVDDGMTVQKCVYWGNFVENGLEYLGKSAIIKGKPTLVYGDLILNISDVGNEMDIMASLRTCSFIRLYYARALLATGMQSLAVI